MDTIPISLEGLNVDDTISDNGKWVISESAEFAYSSRVYLLLKCWFKPSGTSTNSISEQIYKVQTLASFDMPIQSPFVI